MILIKYYNQRWESYIYPSRPNMKTKSHAQSKGQEWVEYASNLEDRNKQSLICIH